MGQRKRYRLIEHTADLGVFVRGATLAELLADAAFAVTDIILDAASARCRDELDLTLEATTPDRLLIKWLTELLYLFETRLFVGADFAVALAGDCALTARVRGERYDAVRHGFKTEVKAVTWHGLRVDVRPGGCRAFFIVDL